MKDFLKMLKEIGETEKKIKESIEQDMISNPKNTIEVIIRIDGEIDQLIKCKGFSLVCVSAVNKDVDFEHITVRTDGLSSLEAAGAGALITKRSWEK